MIDFFTKLYDSVIDKNAFLTKVRWYSLQRVSIRVIANAIIPIYFISTKANPKYSISNKNYTSNNIIVSLTSFPVRINRIWLVLESLLRQEIKPDRIILWISEKQFTSSDKLPKKLLKLKKRGIEIRFCENDLRSHKKYYYALKEFSNSNIITVDDDVFYHSKTLSYLLDAKNKYPNTICCNEASNIKTLGGEIMPYREWENVIGASAPTFNIIPIGVGGVLYPPGALYSDVLNEKIFIETCFFADDIWLNVMSRLQGTKVTKTSFNSHYLPVINFKNITLNSINVREGLNDKQLASIRKYYTDNTNIDPFVNLTK